MRSNSADALRLKVSFALLNLSSPHHKQLSLPPPLSSPIFELTEATVIPQIDTETRLKLTYVMTARSVPLWIITLAGFHWQMEVLCLVEYVLDQCLSLIGTINVGCIMCECYGVYEESR